MYKFLLSIIFLVLAGCDNSITNNSGALPNIDFTGTIWAGNVRYARVQFVGVDQYGQVQRQADGSYYGDSHYSDEQGQFSASIQGAYTGSLVAVASYADDVDVVTPATDTQAAMTETFATQIRCVLPAGCKNEAGAAIDYGTWYSAPESFEMWGAISSVTGLEQFNITPVTHLAAKQAFNQGVSLGTGCDMSDLNSCEGTELKNNIFTADTIYEGNHRAKQFFLSNSGLHVNVTPWYEGFTAGDSVAEIESAKHGLISMALQKFESDRTDPAESVMDSLNWWVASFLKHDGNFYIDGSTDASSDLDATKLFQAISDVQNMYVAASKETSSLTSAESEFTTMLSGLVASSTLTDDLLPFVEVVYNEATADKILAAQELVSKVQSWALNLESPPVDGSGEVQYSVFFDADVAKEITDMEDEWAEYNQKLSPVMKSFFKPMIKTAEYALTCMTPDGCEAGHDLAGRLSFNTDTGVTLIDASGGALTLDGDTYNYTEIRLVGKFDDALAQTDAYKIFTFTDAYLKTSEGDVELKSVDGVLPSVAFWLNSSLVSGSAPDVSRLDVVIPNLVLISNTSTQYQFSSSTLTATLIGTKDAVESLSPFHFNILSTTIEGTFSKQGGQGDAMDFRLILDSENAETYYSPNRFPDLEMSIDSSAFKKYAQFDPATNASDFISDQGGWFTLPSYILPGDLPVFDGDGVTVLTPGIEIPSAVTFYDRGGYDNWKDLDNYKLLAELLSLDYTESAKLGTLDYPGGETALVIFKTDSTQENEVARQCSRVGDVWGCQAALSVSTLGCGDELGSTTVTVVDAFTWLKSEECIAQVKIDGRGVYDIAYPDLSSDFTNLDAFNITLNSPEYLGIKNFNVSLISKFVDEQDELRPVALMRLTGAAPDFENITMGFSLTHDYIGTNSSFGSSIGLDSVIPYGDNSIWLAVGSSSTDQDALVYYIQDVNITMTVFGFDYADEDSTANPSHTAPLAVIRYDGQLIGSLREEGSLYVIRYIDGTWQLL